VTSGTKIQAEWLCLMPCDIVSFLLITF